MHYYICVVFVCDWCVCYVSGVCVVCELVVYCVCDLYSVCMCVVCVCVNVRVYIRVCVWYDCSAHCIMFGTVSHNCPS